MSPYDQGVLTLTPNPNALTPIQALTPQLYHSNPNIKAEKIATEQAKRDKLAQIELDEKVIFI